MISISSLPNLPDALCRDEWPDLFYPNTAGPTQRKRALQEAKTICDRCPARTRCLEYAIANKEVHGIWAGVDFERGKR